MGIPEPEGEDSVGENSEVEEIAGRSNCHENGLAPDGLKEEEFYDAMADEEEGSDNEEGILMDQAEIDMECSSPEEATALSRLCEWLMRTL